MDMGGLKLFRPGHNIPGSGCLAGLCLSFAELLDFLGFAGSSLDHESLTLPLCGLGSPSCAVYGAIIDATCCPWRGAKKKGLSVSW